MAVASIEELLAQSRDRLDSGQIAPALAGMTEAYQAAAAESRWAAAAWAANWIGHVYEHHLGDLDTALVWFAATERAASAGVTPLPRTLATARFNAGLVEARRGRTTVALAHFEAARAAAEATGDGALQAACGERLGLTMAELGAWAEGRNVLEAAGRLAEQAGDALVASCCADEVVRITTALDSAPGDQFARLARFGLDRCLAAVRQPAPALVLDAGCGSGPELVAIAERWPASRVVGIDEAETARSIRVPRRLRPRVEVRAGDLTAGGLGQDRCDVAVCHAVLHTVDQPALVLGGLARALRPGGELVGALFTDAYYRGLRGRLLEAGVPLRRPAISHTEAGIAAALAGAGLTSIEIWTEAVELCVEPAGCPAHLERLLGRPVEAGEAERLLDAIGRPLRLDLSPLSFRATAPWGRPAEKADIGG
jgi:SAM-dependent methyltransferase